MKRKREEKRNQIRRALVRVNRCDISLQSIFRRFLAVHAHAHAHAHGKTDVVQEKGQRREIGDNEHESISAQEDGQWALVVCKVKFGVGLSFLFFALPLTNHIKATRYPRNACRSTAIMPARLEPI